MAEVEVERALKSAEIVKAEKISGRTYVQCWRGGTYVNVYVVENGDESSWSEITVWSISDEEGGPVEADEMRKHMCMRFAKAKEQGGRWE